MSESIFLSEEWPEYTCPICGVTSREGWISVVSSSGREVWQSCGVCWGAMQRDLPTMVELQQENQQLKARLQQVEAEAAAMRGALSKAQEFHANLPLHTEDRMHPFTQTASDDVYTCATAALTTTAGTDLLDRLRVATDALEALERAHTRGWFENADDQCKCPICQQARAALRCLKGE